MGIAHLVASPTEKPGTILTRVRAPVWQGIFLPESPSSADSLTVSVQTRISICLYINICAHVNNPKSLAAIPLIGHTKTLHTLIGMGSAALAASVPYPGKQVRRHFFSRKGQ